MIGNWRAWNLELPVSAERFLDFIIERDLLTAYGTWDGVTACQVLSNALCADFNSYFPDLQMEARRFIDSELNNSALYDEIRKQ